MGPIEAIAPTNQKAAVDPGQATTEAELAQVFSEGIVKFMGMVLMSAQGDITAAIQDNTSNPDAPD